MNSGQRVSFKELHTASQERQTPARMLAYDQRKSLALLVNQRFAEIPPARTLRAFKPS